MTKTANYQLNQWEPSDPIRREDFNESNAAIDAAIKVVADTAESKASAESVAALTAALGSGGKNCRIAWGSYTGNGKYGSSNPTSLTFDFCPVLVLINCDSLDTSKLFRGNAKAINCYKGSLSLFVSWAEHSVSWYSEIDAENQNNSVYYTYRYVVFGYSN